VDRSRLLTFTVSVGLVCAGVLELRAAGLFVGPELAVYDRLLRSAARADPPVASPVVLIQITEADIREQEHWPISDRTLAQALRALRAAGARVIGLDLYRDLGVPPGAESFQRILRENPTIIAVRKFGDPNGAGIPGPAALAGTGRIGFNDVVFDADETVRRGLLFQDDGTGAVEWSFALLVALAAEGIAPAPDPEHPDWLRLGPTTLPPFEANDGGYVGADAAGYQFLADFAAAPDGFVSFRLGTLLRGELEADALRDKVVLIGSNAKSLPDLFEVPVGGRIPGVELHAHMVDQLLRTARGEVRPRKPLREWQEVTVVLLAGLLGCALASGTRGGTFLGASTLLGVVLGGGVLLAGVAVTAFRLGWWLPIVAPALAWVGGAGLVTVWLSSRERVQRAELMGLFARHVSPEIAEEIWRNRDDFLHDGRPRPRLLRVTVLFVDMKGYSAQARKMEPARLLEWVNDFLARMAREVERHGGVVEDYFGDGFKANFGFPLPRTNTADVAADASRAVGSALAMASALVALNADFAARGLPRCAIRVGIASGTAVVGSIGSEGHLKYSAVGDVVVTAQRLEGTTAVEHDFDAQPCRILVSESTLSLLERPIRSEPVGVVSLKGGEEGVAVHRVLGAGPPV